MKKFSTILRYTSSALVALVALVFTVLEATLLITLDFTLYENQFIALIQIILRFTIALIALTIGILAIVKREQSFLLSGICLTASSMIMIFFISNGIGICLFAVSAIFLLSQLLFSKMQNSNDIT